MRWPKLPKTGPDSWQGIRTAIRCMCIMTITAGGVRSTGVFYVGIMNHFGVSHGEAAWPVSVAGAMLGLIGSVAGALSQAFSPKPVILCGALLVCLGLLTSILAPSVAWLTLTYGVIFGSGLGTVYTVNVIFLQQYFVKMRGLALGMNYAGSTAAGFIFPVLISYLLGEFGLAGALLIFCGLLFNVFVLCLTHHEAPWLVKETRRVKDTGSATLQKGPEDRGDDRGDDRVEDGGENEANNGGQDGQNNGRPDGQNSGRPDGENCGRSDGPNDREQDGGENRTDERPEMSRTDATKANTSTDKVSLLESFTVLKEAQFLVIILSFFFFLYAQDAYMTTVIDYIVDQGIPLITATTVIPWYSITDMLARLIIPQLGDRGYINKMLLQSLAYSTQSVAYFILPIAAGTGYFGAIVAVAMLHSVGVGTAIVMYGVSMADAVGLARLPMAYGIVGFVTGLACFSKPYFLGYFRDTVGSYEQMYTVCSILTGLSAVLWLITWYMHRAGKCLASNDSSKTGNQVSVVVDSGLEQVGFNSQDAISIGQRSRTSSAVLYL